LKVLCSASLFLTLRRKQKYVGYVCENQAQIRVPAFVKMICVPLLPDGETVNSYHSPHKLMINKNTEKLTFPSALNPFVACSGMIIHRIRLTAVTHFLFK
jgi:hypothetical protein